MEEEYIQCFACGAKSLNIEGESHKYMLSSPGCWAMYCEVLEKEYSDFRLARSHNYTVDAYACQHPGKKEVSQAYKSVGIHLCSLHMYFHHGMDVAEGGNFKNKFSQYNKEHDFIHWLEPPSSLGPITVFDLWNMENEEAHLDISKEWAHSTWKAWQEHLSTIEMWVQDFLSSTKDSFNMS